MFLSIWDTEERFTKNQTLHTTTPVLHIKTPHLYLLLNLYSQPPRQSPPINHHRSNCNQVQVNSHRMIPGKHPPQAFHILRGLITRLTLRFIARLCIHPAYQHVLPHFHITTLRLCHIPHRTKEN